MGRLLSDVLGLLRLVRGPGSPSGYVAAPGAGGAAASTLPPHRRYALEFAPVLSETGVVVPPADASREIVFWI